MTLERIRLWLAVVLGPPLAIVLAIVDFFWPRRCWWEER